jgi:hypothetical protein
MPSVRVNLVPPASPLGSSRRVLLNAISFFSSTIPTGSAQSEHGSVTTHRSGRCRVHTRSTRALDPLDRQSCIEVLLELGSIDDAVVAHDERTDPARSRLVTEMLKDPPRIMAPRPWPSGPLLPMNPHRPRR